MRTLRKAILLLMLPILVLACSKEKIDEHPDFIGYWVAESGSSVYELSIEDNGDARLLKTSGASFVEHTGRFKIKDETLRIGLKKMQINQYPAQQEGAFELWTTELDGIVFYRF